MAKATMAKIAAAKKLASSGVDYSPRNGARCPWCGKRTRICTTRPWEDNIRIRYHLCTASRCALATMKVTIKSIEVDVVEIKN